MGKGTLPDGTPIVQKPHNFTDALRAKQPGDLVKVKVLRGGSPHRSDSNANQKRVAELSSTGASACQLRFLKAPKPRTLR